MRPPNWSSSSGIALIHCHARAHTNKHMSKKRSGAAKQSLSRHTLFSALSSPSFVPPPSPPRSACVFATLQYLSLRLPTPLLPNVAVLADLAPLREGSSLDFLVQNIPEAPPNNPHFY
eukprot:1633537-Rhodomonas_salina.2